MGFKLINPDVITHLERYFNLSRSHFIEGDYPLAAFLAITTIEETAKVLFLEGQSLEDVQGKKFVKEARRHQNKYLWAMINLIDQEPQNELFPSDLKQEVDSWWDTSKLARIRNDCLYLRYGRNNQVTTPKRAINSKLAALLVYTAGIALAVLEEYIHGFPTGWKISVLEITNKFRQQYLKG